MTQKVYNVLFLCTGNSARSIMAETILKSLGKGRFKAHSAGSMPTGRVNPHVLGLLEKKGLPTKDLRSKNWDEFSGPDAEELDFVFTLCDKAAGEVCPVWPGQPITAHWGFEDPASAEGSPEAKQKAFERVFQGIGARIRLFLALPLNSIDRMSLLHELQAIGRTQT